MKKTLAFGIVLLFIGVAFAPSLYADVVPISEQQELIEIPIQMCGLGGINEYTAKLSKEDADRLDTLFVDIHSRLNASESREETISIYKEAVVELDNLGLLGGFSVGEVQKLITREQYENSYCFVHGEATKSKLFDAIPFICTQFLLKLSNFLLNLCNIFPFLSPILLLLLPLNAIAGISWGYYAIFISLINIQSFYGYIALGETTYYYEDYSSYYRPSRGWIMTNGLNGIIEQNGSFIGSICEITTTGGTVLYHDVFNIGIRGFAGLKIGNHILGFAQEVKLKNVSE